MERTGEPRALPWHVQNQRHLAAALATMRSALTRQARGGQTSEDERAAAREPEAIAAAMSAPPALDVLARLCGLSSFERAVVTLCAGVELDGRIGPLCAEVHGDPRRASPTFSLALAMLPDAHWSAVSPAGPLRRFHLVAMGEADSLVRAPLRIDERILGFLTGVDHIDARLEGVVERAVVEERPQPSQRGAVDRALRALGEGRVVQIEGGDVESRRAVVGAVGEALGRPVHRLRLYPWPGGLDEVTLGRLVHRELLLAGSVGWVDAEDLDALDPPRAAALGRLIDRLPSALIVTSRDARRLGARPDATVDVRKPVPAEQRALWASALASLSDEAALSRDEGLLDALVSHFDVGGATIRRACGEARLSTAGAEAAEARPALWSACCRATRTSLDGLAQRVVARARWEDLVLPARETEALRALLTHARERARVYGAWGFGERQSYGLGVSAVFAGQSGTGKTMAAEAIASEMGVDLYRVDLSQVVSKYIGETEKSLRRVFDAADEGGMVLLFDEADALFGRRSEVKDSHDRYANIEVSYLLQRMEAYRGVSILTTNQRGALDAAFLRRVRFIVTFPFPKEPERERIWRRAFPARAPLEGIDYARLARIDVAGGHIRNIALGAAFLAAGDGTAVRMEHVFRAAKLEFDKLERSWNGV